MNYSDKWDLSTVPTELLRAEINGRLIATHRKPKNLVPCAQCRAPLGARERRQPCPHCGAKNKR